MADTPHSPIVDVGEADLLARLRAGEDAAFEQLVRDNIGRMLAVARRHLNNEDDTQEAVQDAFTQAFRALPRFEGHSKLSTWLHRITVNAALMKRRTKSRRPERSLDSLLPAFREDGHRVLELADRRPGAAGRGGTDRGSTEEAGRLDPEQAAAVRRLIDELPDDYRTVLVLRDIEELDTGETARVLELSESAVKTRLHRARQALRTLLEREHLV